MSEANKIFQTWVRMDSRPLSNHDQLSWRNSVWLGFCVILTKEEEKTGGEFMVEKVVEKRKLSREEKLEQEREKLEQELAEGEFETLRARVAYILNRYPETRDSDIVLQHRYWATFHPERYKYGQSVTADDMMNLARLTHLTRMRAKIQNQFGLFLASEGVERNESAYFQAVRENIVVDGPIGLDTSAVFCDETGKESKFLGVGGVWFANVYDSWQLQKHLKGMA